MVVGWYFLWESYIWSILESLLIIGCAIWLTENLRWRIFFGWLGTYTLPAVILFFWIFRNASTLSLQEINSYVYWNGIAYTILAIFTGAWLLALIVLDWREGKRFHWSHWCGTVAFLLLLAAQLATAGWEYYKYYHYWSTIPPQLQSQGF